jgi:uncharacterized protein YjgD (DUF1641 family)
VGIFLAGFLAAVAFFAAVATVLVHVKYSVLYEEAQSAKPLISNAARLLDHLEEAGLLDLVREFEKTLPRLTEAIKEYRELYMALGRYRPLVELVYNETHSPGFNETVEELRREAEALSQQPLIGQALGEAFSRLAKLLVEARKLSELAKEAYSLIEALPPEEAEKLLTATTRLLYTLKNYNIEEMVRDARVALESANETIGSLPEPGLLEKVFAATAFSAASISALIIYYVCRSGRGQS